MISENDGKIFVQICVTSILLLESQFNGIMTDIYVFPRIKREWFMHRIKSEFSPQNILNNSTKKVNLHTQKNFYANHEKIDLRSKKKMVFGSLF